jgi:hypothetical protein
MSVEENIASIRSMVAEVLGLMTQLGLVESTAGPIHWASSEQ